MKIQNQSRVVQVPLGRANAYCVIGEVQAFLIDTGTNGNEQKIVQALGNLGLSPSDIRLIILTHTHYDHCGSLKALKEMTGARIVVHRNEAMCLRDGHGGFPKGSTRLTRGVSFIGRTIGKRMGSYAPVLPDILITERFGLKDYGIDGYILPTPGHTSGSISVIIHNRDAIVGDTLFNIFRNSVFPPFADDQEELLRSWGRLWDTGCQIFHPGHGSPFGLDRFAKSLETERKRRAGR